MKNIIKSVFITACVILVFTSCTNSDKTYPITTESITTYELTPTTTVATVDLPTMSATPTLYTADDIIEAYVTSNDAAGNFYKSISFQSVPTASGSPIGFSVSVDKSMLFSDGFTPGRKVYIKLKGLYFAKIYGSMQLGVYDASQTTLMSGISKFDWDKYLFPSATILPESALVRSMNLATAATDANLNTLIDVTTVEFADNSLARTYFDIDSGGYATNHDIVDVTGGTTRYCRVSQYAPFSVHNVPSGRGTIRGVMTKYSSDYQFMVRSESDFSLTNPRTYTFNTTLNENFSSFATSQIAFPDYLNFATVGTKKWLIKSGALEMSSYGGTVENNKAYFIVPVNMDTANSLKFDLKVTYYTGALGLKIYRSTDYVPGNKLSTAALYDISSSFSTAMPTANAVLTGLTYNIPTTVTGNGYFIFEYTGTNISTGPPVTTTIDIDNIIIN